MGRNEIGILRAIMYASSLPLAAETDRGHGGVKMEEVGGRSSSALAKSRTAIASAKHRLVKFPNVKALSAWRHLSGMLLVHHASMSGRV